MCTLAAHLPSVWVKLFVQFSDCWRNGKVSFDWVTLLICATRAMNVFVKRNICFETLHLTNPKCAHTQQWTHTHREHTPGAGGRYLYCGTREQLGVRCRGVKSTWKSCLSKSTDTLPWKLLHYKLQVTNSKPTWVKALQYLILTVLKYFTYTRYRLKDALVKETWQSKSVTLWRSWKQAEARIYVQTRTNNKPKTTDNHYSQQVTKN